MSKLENFDVILADWPWGYNAAPFFKKSLAVQYKYPTLTLEQGKNIDVQSIAKKDCWLFMWVVGAEVKNCIELMEAWGFKYRTIAFCWSKKTKNGKQSKTYGRCCTQPSVELVLVGKKGNPKRYALNVAQEFSAQVRGYSKKPDELYHYIDRIVEEGAETPVKKIELFARQQWGNWHALGNDDAINQPNNPLCHFGDIRDLIGFKNKGMNND